VHLAKENYFRVNRESELTEKLQQHILQGYQPVHYDMRQYNWDEIAGQIMEVYRLLK
jgi:hypothetical protein